MPFLILFVIIWAFSLGSVILAVTTQALIPTIGYGLIFVGLSIVFATVMKIEIK